MPSAAGCEALREWREAESSEELSERLEVAAVA